MQFSKTFYVKERTISGCTGYIWSFCNIHVTWGCLLDVRLVYMNNEYTFY
jgi:hypothetical protein